MKPSSVFLLSLLLGLTACISQQAVIQNYYTLEYSAPTENDTNDSIQVLPGICEIEQIEVGLVYDRNQIVNRSDSHEISYYKYHQWAEKPSRALMELMMYYLEKASLFERVSSRYNRAIPDYRFSATVHQLEVLEDKDQFSAHVHLEFRILNNADNRVLLHHEADRIEPLGAKDLNLFAKTVSEVFHTELEQFADKIRDQPKLLEE